MCNCLDGKSLRYQMTAKFLGLFMSCLFIIGLSCIIVVVVTNNKFETNSENALRNQTAIHAEKTIQGSVQAFSELMQNSANNVKIYSKVLSDTYRSGYSMSIPKNYFEYGDTYLKSPLIQDNRQNKPVSLGASAYYYPSFTPSDYNNLSFPETETRDNSAHVDPYWKTIYAQYSDFVIVYAGFEDGMFRSYPGTGTLDTDPTRSYDPRTRGWYNGAINIDNAKVYVTSPYQDFNGRGWMITIAMIIKDPNSGDYLGVAAADMLISKIKQSIEDIQFLESGKVTLFDIDGNVVADREWDADSNEVNGYTYNDLQNPSVSSDLWVWILETGHGNTKTGTHTLNGEIWVVTSTRLNSFSQYYMCVFVKESEILAPMSSITDEMKSVNGRIIGINISIIILSALLCTVIIVGTSYCISKPLDEANHGLDQIFKNVGRTGYAADIELNANGVGVEQQRMANQFRNMIDHLTNDDEHTDPLLVMKPKKRLAELFYDQPPSYSNISGKDTHSTTYDSYAPVVMHGNWVKSSSDSIYNSSGSTNSKVVSSDYSS